MFLPSMLMLNTYFEAKRGLAAGIVTSGSGLGVIVVVPVVEYLIGHYGWRGSMLMLAGMYMQICWMALLLRPVSDYAGPSIYETGTDNKSSKEEYVKPLLTATVAENETIPVATPKVIKRSFTQLKQNDEHSSLTNITKVCNVDIKHQKCLSLQSLNTTTPLTHRKHAGSGLFDRKDAFLCNSIRSLAKENYSMVDKNISTENDEFEIEPNSNEKEKCCSMFSNPILSNVCKREILMNKAVILLGIGSLLNQSAQFIPTTFIGDHAANIGVSGTHLSSAFIIFGKYSPFSILVYEVLEIPIKRIQSVACQPKKVTCFRKTG